MMKEIFIPMNIIGKEKSLFIIWILLVLMGSLLGVLFTFLITKDWSANTITIIKNGSFYLISISFATALIADLFSSLILEKKEYLKEGKENKILFFENKIITIVLLVFLIAIMAVGYASLSKSDSPNFTIYVVQGVSYLFTIFLGVYSFGLKYSYLHEDMLEQVIERVDKLKNSNSNKDIKGRPLK